MRKLFHHLPLATAVVALSALAIITICLTMYKPMNMVTMERNRTNKETHKKSVQTDVRVLKLHTKVCLHIRVGIFLFL